MVLFGDGKRQRQGATAFFEPSWACRILPNIGYLLRLFAFFRLCLRRKVTGQKKSVRDKRRDGRGPEPGGGQLNDPVAPCLKRHQHFTWSLQMGTMTRPVLQGSALILRCIAPQQSVMIFAVSRMRMALPPGTPAIELSCPDRCPNQTRPPTRFSLSDTAIWRSGRASEIGFSGRAFQFGRSLARRASAARLFARCSTIHFRSRIGPRSRRYPKLGPHTASVRRMLQENVTLPPSARLSIKAIYERIRDEEGFRGGIQHRDGLRAADRAR